jgi:hypothetical protein
MTSRGIVRRKRAHERAVRINITLQPALYEAMAAILKRGGYAGPAEYVAARVRLDAQLDQPGQLLLPLPSNP